MTPGTEQFIQVCTGVFVGTLPLLGVIGWAAFMQDKRLTRIESQLDELGKDLKALGIRMSNAETKVAVVEAKLDRPHIVAPTTR